MSLITLRSQNNNITGLIEESSAYIRNYFKESIVFNPGDTFELVSISITKTDKFEIVTGTNDRFVWRIGQGPSSLADRSPKFSQHQVVIPEGSYNGQQLALIIQNQLNKGVILGNFAPPLDNDVTNGGFQVIYTENTTVNPPTPASFSITYRQAPTPPQNADTLLLTKLIEFVPNALTLSIDTGINNGWLFRVNPSAYQNARNITSVSNGAFGNKSAFPNGGEVEIVVPPSNVLTSVADFTGQVQVIDYDKGSGTSNIFLNITSPILMNNWVYRLEFQDGIVGEVQTLQLYNGGVAGQVLESVVGNAGTLYAVGETGLFTGGSGSNLQYEITAVDGAGGVSTYTVTNPGQNFVVTDICQFQPPVNPSGTTADIEITRLITGGGTGYSVGDAGSLVGTTSLPITVASVDAFGSILTFNFTAGGSGFSAGSIISLTQSVPTGSGAQFEILSVSSGQTLRFGYLSDDGFLGISNTTNFDATNPINWNYGKWTYNTITEKFTSSSGTASLTNTHGKIQTTAGGGFEATTDPGVYNRVEFGLARNILIDGLTLYPANVNAQVYPGPGGYDIQFNLQSDTVNNDIQISCSGFVKRPGTNFPNPNWRTIKNYILSTDNVRSSNWNSLGTTPANWATFVYGTDHIRIRMERYGVDKSRVYIAHDNAGDQAFSEEVVVLQQFTQGSVGGEVFSPVVIENSYPFRPVVYMGKGTRFGNNDVKLRGIYDVRSIDGSNANIVSTTFNGNLVNKINMEQKTLNEDDFVEDYSITGVPHLNVATPMTLPSLFKFGIVAEDEENGDNLGTFSATGLAGPEINDANGVQTQLSGRSLLPNTSNTNSLLGLPRWSAFDTGQTTRTLKTNVGEFPATNLLEPSLMVEFPDFNIKSYSGESSDTGKAIAVIPREQWTTNEKTGTLIYVTNYPIPIDLGISNTQTINQITARLRQMDGTVADDLLHPTEITIRKREGTNVLMKKLINTLSGGTK